MALSVIEPIGQSFERMKRILFEPFDLGKWCILGFCVFLAQLGQGGGGGGGGMNMGGGPSGRSGGEFIGEAKEWFLANLAIIIAVVVVVVVIVFTIGIVLTWLSSRGKFMFLDGVVHNRAAVVEPWHQFRYLGNSLFWFRFVLGLVSFGAVLLILVLGLLVALPDIQAERFGPCALGALLLIFGLFLPLALVMGLIGLLLNDFVVPIMYRRDIRVLEAVGCLHWEILRGNVGPIVLYCLMKFVLALAAGSIVALLGCMTCCIGLLPYISSVLFLPVWVFLLCYPLYFLQQFGDQYLFFADEARPPQWGPVAPPPFPQDAAPPQA